VATKWQIKIDGTLWTWGDNSKGQLGDGTTINKYTPILSGSPANLYSNVHYTKDFAIIVTLAPANNNDDLPGIDTTTLALIGMGIITSILAITVLYLLRKN